MSQREQPDPQDAQESSQQPEQQPPEVADDDADTARSGAHENAGAADRDKDSSAGQATGNPNAAG